MKKTAYIAAMLCAWIPALSQSRIEIDLSQKGDPVPKTLYGIFFEEITGSGDGGLYAEMIRNRGFEEGTLPSGTTLRNGFATCVSTPRYSDGRVQDFRIPWSEDLFMTGWRVQYADGSQASSEITEDGPLNAATPHSLKVGASKAAGEIHVVNSGYWGMHFEEGLSYDVEFYLRTERAAWAKPALADAAGHEIASVTLPLNADGVWHRYTARLTAGRSASDATFHLVLPQEGPVWVDYVSLFPEDTYKGRPGGFRRDLATLIEDLHPSFIRWPGGCIVEGLTLENRVKWKETIGPAVERPGEYNLWGYRSTYGIGYHEFLQFCEDIGADGMFVCNAGMSCLFRNGDYVTGDALEPLIQEALDAVEYALGDAHTTRWGAERARNGHPDPFPLRYVEVGNENVFSLYAANYNRFHKAIKEKWPQVEVITALMFSENLKEVKETDIIDPHYYETVEWFYNNADVYDKLPPRLPYKIYIGEYAAIGQSNLYASLAEAAFLTGVERNGGKVQMVSYAPLVEHEHFGVNHLLAVDQDKAFGRTNYQVMKMFSGNMPDYNVSTLIKGETVKTPYSPHGRMGLSTGGTVSQFKDLKVVAGNKTLYETDFSDFADRWTVYRGDWNARDGVLTQSEMGDGLAILEGLDVSNCIITLKARRDHGNEGFRVVFGFQDTEHYFMADLGSHTNESVLFREMGDNGSVSLFDYRNQTFLRDDHWYDVRIEIRDNIWKCYLDGRLAYRYDYRKVTRHYAVSGYDAAAGELVVKLVNAETQPWKPALSLKGGKVAGPITRITLTGPRTGENSFSAPDAIVPVTTTSVSTDLTVEPFSFSIFRIPVNPARIRQLKAS